jgi:hypothetical protein
MPRCKGVTEQGLRCKHSAKEDANLCGIHERIYRYNSMWGEGHPGAHHRMIKVGSKLPSTKTGRFL